MNLLSHYKNLPAKYFYHCAFLTVSIFLNHVNEISKYILVKKMSKLCSLKTFIQRNTLKKLAIFNFIIESSTKDPKVSYIKQYKNVKVNNYSFNYHKIKSFSFHFFKNVKITNLKKCTQQSHCAKTVQKCYSK